MGKPEPTGGGFSGAKVYKLQCRNGHFALRGWPTASEPRRLRGLHRFLHHLAVRGAPVAVPLADSNGETLVQHDGRYWQVEPWLPGKADFHRAPTDAKLAGAMSALAGLHDAARTFECLPQEAEWFGGLDFGPAPAVLDRARLMNDGIRGLAALTPAVSRSRGGDFAGLARRALLGFERFAEPVLRELEAVATVEVPLLPVFRDVWHDHVLFTGDAVTGLIDPAACRRDTVATDLSRLLGSLWGDEVGRWEYALSRYSTVRPLSPEEAALIPVLDRSGLLLSAVTWLRRRYLVDVPCETPAVVSRLRTIVQRIEAVNRNASAGPTSR